MPIWVRVLSGLVALPTLLLVLDAAIRTFLLPRSARVRLSSFTARVVRKVFSMFAGSKRSYEERDQVLSLFPSIVLLSYQALWLGLTLVSFAFGFVAAGVSNFASAFAISGSSIFTLGTSSGHGGAQITLGYVEAGIGLTLLALLIAFIPTLYAAFQRREISVSRLSVRAGVPATPWGILEIAQSVNSYDKLDELWREWEQWFIEVGETHSSLPILNFYRSPTKSQTWIGSAASVLDAAALFNAVVDLPASPTAGLCIRSGWLNMRRIADYFEVHYPLKVSHKTPITITREEFDIVLDRLVREGVPVIADREACWRDFKGWRVNYDFIIEASYSLFNCPRTDWRSASIEPLIEPSNRRGQIVDD
ncbi:MAG: hypothetical protein WAN30_06820 [Acidimicrobiales bacterium]